MQVQVALTVFAANFVGWAQEWVESRVLTAPVGMRQELHRTRYLVRVAANSVAQVEAAAGQVVVRFSSLSSLAGTLIHLAGPHPVQLALQLYGGP